MGGRRTRSIPGAPRLRRLATEWKPGGPPRPPRPGAWPALGTLLAAGLVVGPLELALTLAIEPFYDPAPGLFRGNRHVAWIIPAVNLAIFGAAGALLAGLARTRRGAEAAARLASRALAAWITRAAIASPTLLFFSRKSSSRGRIIDSTRPRTSGLFSRPLVCPWNCGSCTQTESTAVRPSRISSALTSTPFLSSSWSFK